MIRIGKEGHEVLWDRDLGLDCTGSGWVESQAGCGPRLVLTWISGLFHLGLVSSALQLGCDGCHSSVLASVPLHPPPALGYTLGVCSS